MTHYAFRVTPYTFIRFGGGVRRRKVPLEEASLYLSPMDALNALQTEVLNYGAIMPDLELVKVIRRNRTVVGIDIVSL